MERERLALEAPRPKAVLAYTLDDARDKIIKGQSVFLDRLEQILRPMPSI